VAYLPRPEFIILAAQINKGGESFYLHLNGQIEARIRVIIGDRFKKEEQLAILRKIAIFLHEIF
jgi:hypothetical protein